MNNICAIAWFKFYLYSAGITSEICFHVNIKNFLEKSQREVEREKDAFIYRALFPRGNFL